MKHILYFTAEWCNPCKRTRPILEEMNRDGVINIKFIDVDSEIDLARTYQVQSIPTFVLIQDGEELRRMTGAKTREQFDGFINE